MKKKESMKFIAAVGLLAAFVIWTAVVRLVDVQGIGPLGSAVGLATINRYLHGLTGVHLSLYVLTDWLGLVPFIFVMGFALLGLCQWIRRRRLWKVDTDILVLGGFYAVVLTMYVFFETVVVNYRPILINGYLEVSYPSSITMLVLCVMPTAVLQLNTRIQNRILRRCAAIAITAFTVVMVVSRFVSGVHWFSDIFGGILLSGGLVLLYCCICGRITRMNME